MAPFCVECNSEMSCYENGVTVHYGNGHCYRGDEYQCASCKKRVIAGFSSSFHDYKWKKPGIIRESNKKSRFEILREENNQ